LTIEVFSNPKVLLLYELLSSRLVPSARLCLTPHEFRSASSVHWDSESQHSVTPSWHEPSKTLNLKSNTLPENGMITTHPHTTYIRNTHRHPFNTDQVQEKLLFVLNNGKCLSILQDVPELSPALHAFYLHVLLSSFQNEISLSLLPEELSALPSRYTYPIQLQ
jgi:hypothetical protein